jgi:predicted transposase/invertase (TIGR01784 family)
MARYLNPKVDIVFKKIFGQHPDILKSFLNAMLPLAEERKIVELSYLPNEQIPQIPDFKNTIADVKCTDDKGHVYSGDASALDIEFL